MMLPPPSIPTLGCGFVGRHLVDHLVSNDLAAYIRVVDKTPPQMAWMNRRHTDLFTSKPNVHFVSANLIDEASCERAFSSTGCQTDDAQTAPVPFPAATAPSWDIVINCAAETRPGRTDAVHADGTVRLSMNCARQSRAHRVRRYVELSSGNMHGSVQPGKRPADERAPIDPWTAEARHKATVERRLHAGDDGALEGLAYTVVRLPLVYGTGDRRGLGTSVAHPNRIGRTLTNNRSHSASHHHCGHLQVPGRHDEAAVDQRPATEHRARVGRGGRHLASGQSSAGRRPGVQCGGRCPVDAGHAVRAAGHHLRHSRRLLGHVSVDGDEGMCVGRRHADVYAAHL